MSELKSEHGRVGGGAGQVYIPFAIQVGAAWSWRLIVMAVVAAGIFWAGSKISLIIISVMVAALLAGLLAPVVYFLRKRGIWAGVATAIAEVGMLVLVGGLLTLVGRELTAGISALSDQVLEGYRQLIAQLNNLPFDIGIDRIDTYLSDILTTLKDNSGTILNGVASVGATAADIGTGTVIALFTLIFFLLEGEKIWLFIVGLFPRPAQRAVNGAGRRGWVSLVSYVRVQVFVAFVDALGIGLSAFFLGVPLAFPLGVLVFLGSFVPVIGALLTGAMAVLLALVANGPINALIMLVMVLVVQQVESHILQPLVMGKAVSLHPLAVVFAVATGSILFGVIGALFAVPVLAIVNTVVRYLAHREWETDPNIRETEFLYPHEIERRQKKSVVEEVKDRVERFKGQDEDTPASEDALESAAEKK